MAINFDDLKKLNPKQKALIIGLVFILIGYFYYMFFLQGALDKKVALGTKLTELEQQVAEKERAAAQLNRYVREVNALKEAFQVALLKLPNEREIAGLLSAVVQSGKSAGVDFLLFEPKPPEKTPPPGAKPAAGAKPPEAKPGDAKVPPQKPGAPEKFYDEIPIKVQLAGGFHNTVAFFDQIARLPRIVNVEEIAIADAQDVKGRGRVVKTSCIVKTYMFVEQMDKK